MKGTETRKSSTEMLEQVRLDMASDLHRFIQVIAKGKEDVLSEILDLEHKKLSDGPLSIELTLPEGTSEVNTPGMVSMEVALNNSQTSTVTLSLNGRIFPHRILYNSSNSYGRYITLGNSINSITVTGLVSGNLVVATLYNERAALLK